MSSSWTVQGAVNPMMSVLIKDRREDRNKEGRPCEDKGGKWSHAATRQGMSGMTRN